MKAIKYGTVAALSTALLASGLVSFIDAKAEEKENGSEVGYERTYNSDSNVNFIPSTGSTKPIDPTDPTNPNPETPVPPKEGTEGPLSIDFASDFDFGTQEITTEDKVYKAKPQAYEDSEKITPNFVQITDKRGSNAGWSLNLKQDYQFKNDTTQNKEIEGAELRFLAGSLVTDGKGIKPTTHEAKLDATNGSYSKIMTAKATEGSGTWLSSFGGQELVDEDVLNEENEVVTEKRDAGVTLSIPGTTQTDAVEYETTLTWQLTNEPGNGQGNEL
ncbi:MAG: WxL domain-containing protein [Kurthia sp.]|nr:WxL domain-containing protein [Candidatus Kurthia equi]